MKKYANNPSERIRISFVRFVHYGQIAGKYKQTLSEKEHDIYLRPSMGCVEIKDKGETRSYLVPLHAVAFMETDDLT